MNKKIMWSLVIVGFVAIWLAMHTFLSILSVGPDPTHKFSENYRMIRGTLYYLPDPEDYGSIKDVFPERVERFCVIENWLLGETEKGNFAIDLTGNEKFYPLPSLQEIVGMTNVSLSSIDWLGPYDPSEYILRNPAVLRLRLVINYLFAVSMVFCFVHILRRRKIINADQSDSSSD